MERLSRLYAAFYEVCSRLTDRQLRPLRRFAAGGARGRVLELGCGPGANFDYYDWTQAATVDAIDPDPDMLARARRHAEGRIRLHEAFAEDLPFADSTFDSAVCTLVLCTVRDPFQALRELRRVLKPGAQAELRLVEHVRGQRRTAGFQDFVQPLYGRLAGGCVLGRSTEITLAATGFQFEVEGRPSFGPGMPGVYGVARPGG